MTRLDEIKSRLAKIMPGPWVYIRSVNEVRSVDAGPICLIYKVNSENNGNFIASAPEDIAWLVAEVERLQRLQ